MKAGAKRADYSGRSLLPLVVGVTGHRDLHPQGEARLEDEVRRSLAELRALCPNTPLLLLSPLAEGADRLVAREALTQGATLVVPLPLPRAEYEKDFVHPADAALTARSLAEFDGLLQSAVRHFELPLARGNTAQGIAGYGAERDRQYAQVGAYIVRHCHVLIALWDGNWAQPQPEGGTSQIVRYRLGGLPAEFTPAPSMLDAVDAGPVLHIVTPRERGAVAPGSTSARQVLMPGAWERAELRYEGALASTPLAAPLRRLDGYNADAAGLEGLLRAGIARSRGYVMPAAQVASLPASAQSVIDHFAVADSLALHFQHRRHTVLIALFSIAVAAVFCFEVYAHLLPRPWVLALYPLALLIGFGVYRYARKRDFHNKHLDYRALAEGLRVQLHWKLAGLDDEVSDHYLRKQRTELEWVREALRTQLRLADWGMATTDGAASQAGALPMIRDVVVPNWVEDQQGFFERATRRDHDKIQRHERWGLWLLGGGLVAGAIVAASQLTNGGGLAPNWHHGLIVAMGFAPAIAAAIGGYAERLAFSPQAKRYHWMAELFARAETLISDAVRVSDITGARQVILELGKEALGENGDWVLMHRERPPEAPTGG